MEIQRNRLGLSSLEEVVREQQRHDGNDKPRARQFVRNPNLNYYCPEDGNVLNPWKITRLTPGTHLCEWADCRRLPKEDEVAGEQ